MRQALQYILEVCGPLDFFVWYNRVDTNIMVSYIGDTIVLNRLERVTIVSVRAVAVPAASFPSNP